MVSWLEPTLLDFVKERLVADFQSPRGFHAVPADFFQHLLDDAVLGFSRGPARHVLQAEAVPHDRGALGTRGRRGFHGRLADGPSALLRRAPEPRMTVHGAVRGSASLSAGELMRHE